jgi:hypothetical protein
VNEEGARMDIVTVTFTVLMASLALERRPTPTGRKQ